MKTIATFLSILVGLAVSVTLVFNELSFNETYQEDITKQNTADIETAKFIAGRIKDKLQSTRYQPQQAEQPAFCITVSFGVVQATADTSFEQLIARADTALYQAKQQGRNCIVTAD